MRARTAAVKILNSLDDNFYGYEEKTKRFLRRNRFSKEDRAFINTLVKGTIEYVKYLDFIISHSYRGNFFRLEKAAKNILRIGILQARILNTPIHAYVNETVNVTKELRMKRLTGLVNGVLRHIPKQQKIDELLKKKDEIKYLSIKYSYPEWLIKKWIKDHGKKNCMKMIQFNNQTQQTFFRMNSLKSSADTFFTILKNKGFDYEIVQEKPGIYFTVKDSGKLINSNLFKKRLCTIQDFSQAQAVQLLDPKENETILDLCAAPGGKSIYMAQLTQNYAQIKAYDISHKKLSLLRDEVTKQNISSIETLEVNSTEFEFPTADKILIDAPCTGTGILGRKADLRWSRKAEDFEMTNRLQRDILDNGAKALKPGGVLVYATCSIEQEENQQIIKAFLVKHPEFKLVSATDWIDEKYCDVEGFVSILPFKHQISGSFAARLTKGLK